MHLEHYQQHVIDLQILDSMDLPSDWLKAAGWSANFSGLSRAVGNHHRAIHSYWPAFVDAIGAISSRLAQTAYGQGVCYG